MREMGQEAGGGSNLGGAQSLFLAVYLLLLAFFIALVGATPPVPDTLATERQQAVVRSVNDVFAGPGRGLFSDIPSQAGPVIGSARQRMTDLGVWFQAEIPAAHVAEPTPGGVLRVTFPARALFQDGSDALRPGREAFFDRMIAALAAPQGSVARTLDIAVLTGAAAPAPWPGPETLEWRRTTALARVFHGRGAAPGLVLAGFSAGPLDQIVFTFRSRPEPEPEPEPEEDRS